MKPTDFELLYRQDPKRAEREIEEAFRAAVARKLRAEDAGLVVEAYFLGMTEDGPVALVTIEDSEHLHVMVQIHPTETSDPKESVLNAPSA